MTKIESPFYWAGNKLSYMPEVYKVLGDQKFDYIIDLFGGSGNVGLNLVDYATDKVIINDKLRLLPMIYEWLRTNLLNLDYFDSVLTEWNHFSEKESYYTFREHWNEKWRNVTKREDVNDCYVVETALLLYMCSNSMIRFNKKGDFNQGFRGVSYTEKKFNAESIVKIKERFKAFNEGLLNNAKMIKFWLGDFKNSLLSLDLDNMLKINNKKFLFVLDPPYVLHNTFYGANDYSLKDEMFLLKFLSTYSDRIKFIYFNYTSRKDQEHFGLNELLKFHNDFKVITVKEHSKAGQNKEFTPVNEVLIHNL